MPYADHSAAPSRSKLLLLDGEGIDDKGAACRLSYFTSALLVLHKTSHSRTNVDHEIQNVDIHDRKRNGSLSFLSTVSA